MRIFVGRKPQSALAFAFDEGACDIAPLPRFAKLFSIARTNNARIEVPDCCARWRSLLQRLGNKDRGPDCHRSIRLLAQKFAEDG